MAAAMSPVMGDLNACRLRLNVDAAYRPERSQPPHFDQHRQRECCRLVSPCLMVMRVILDHALANTSLSARVTGVTHWHNHADWNWLLSLTRVNPAGQRLFLRHRVGRAASVITQ